MNEHIEKYLDYYLKLNIPPEYAILLRGKWGSGKTWFIKNYIKNEKIDNCLFVSLNGVSSYREIEDAFFQQLHPILASKTMKIAGKLVKGLIKTSIKVDLDGDNKADASITSTVPDINPPDYLKDLDNKILIFDDLERCSIPIPNILGYINFFVEINGLKVIILSNEIEIIGREEENKDKEYFNYLKIKEKVIGKSFEVLSDIEAAVDSFINQARNEKIKDLLFKKKKFIVNVFKDVDYSNLRHFRQTILDFERFSDFIPEIAYSKEKLIDHILELFFIISFELKKGDLTEDNIHKLFRFSYMDISIDKSGTSITKEQEIKDKYTVLGKYQPFNYIHLVDFFKYGSVDKISLEENIRKSPYFQDENTPNWIKLWHYLDLEDDKFDKISDSVLDIFFSNKIDDKYELMQVTGILFDLSEDKLISFKKEEILVKAKENIDILMSKGELQLKEDESFPSRGSHGLTIQGTKFKEFTEIYNYSKQAVENSIQEGYPEKAEKLLEDLMKSVNRFGEQICISNSIVGMYYNIPILKYIPIDKFVDSILKLKNKDKKQLCHTFEMRYRRITDYPALCEDEEWLIKLYESIIKVKNEQVGRVSNLILKNILLRIIKQIVDNIALIRIENDNK